jgi:GAF domain-containing protein
VLDIQSTEAAAFDPDEVEALRVLTNQLAITLQNLRQLTETRAALATYANVGSRELGQLEATGDVDGYTARSDGRTEPAAAIPGEELESAVAAGGVRQITGEEGAGRALLVPVRLRGEVIGAIRVHAEMRDRRWKASEIELLESGAPRAATALENAGLLSSSQRLAEKQRVIGEISANIGASTRFDQSPDLRELSCALGGSG